MKLAYRELIKKALAANLTVSVYDGEEWQVKRSTKLNEIVAAVKSVDEAWLMIRDSEKTIGNAICSAYGLAPDETIIDCSTSLVEAGLVSF
jgi:hypothetical protein